MTGPSDPLLLLTFDSRTQAFADAANLASGLSADSLTRGLMQDQE